MSEYLSSEDAQRVYFFAAAVTGLLVSIMVAFLQSTEVIREEPLLGRPPKSIPGVDKAIRRVKTFRRRFLLRWGLSTIVIATYGLIIPFAIFFVLATNVGWLLPDTPVFLSSGDKAPLTSLPGSQQLLQYVEHQVWNSITLDYNEVALSADTVIVHNPNITLVFWTVFGFRALVELTGLNWLQASTRGVLGAIFGSSKLTDRLSELNKQRMELVKSQQQEKRTSNDNEYADAA